MPHTLSIEKIQLLDTKIHPVMYSIGYLADRSCILRLIYWKRDEFHEFDHPSLKQTSGTLLPISQVGNI